MMIPRLHSPDRPNANLRGVLACCVMLMACLTACSDDAVDDGLSDDLIPPDAPQGLQVSAVARTTLDIAWEAPADDDMTAVSSYELRVATEPFTDQAFSTQGAMISTGSPLPPGDREVARYSQARPGVPLYIGIVARDGVGNRSPVTSVGPIATDVIHSGGILSPAPDDGDNALGYQLVRGHLNGDPNPDIVTSAPFKMVNGFPGAGAVYVFFGGTDGLSATPDLTIEGTENGAQFGNAVAVLDWNGDDVDDIAVGAPLGGGAHGVVYIFYGGANFTQGATLSDQDADVVISADPDSAWFGVSGVGWALSAGHFDGDARQDLAIGVVAADSGVGAVVFLYGGTSDGNVALSELNPGLMNGGVASIVFAPGVAQGAYTLFGSSLFNLGPDQVNGFDQIGTALFQGADAFLLRARATRPPDAGVHQVDFDPQLDLHVVANPLDPDTFFALSMGAVADVSGDGVREWALGSYLEGNAAGAVTLIEGGQVGEVTLADVAYATLTGAENEHFGSAILNNATSADAADIDGDGQEDIAIAGGSGQMSLYVWYGGESLPADAPSSSAHLITRGPAEFTGDVPSIGGTPAVISWAGDIDGDGLEDIVWSDWANNARDGAIEVMR